MPHPIDRARIGELIARISPQLERLPASPKGERDVSLVGNAVTWEDLLGTLEADTDYLYAFSIAWIASEALAAELTPTVIDGDLALPQADESALYFGDLHVKGNLDYARHVIVLGSLTVDGAVTQSAAQHNAIFVLGDFQCAAADVHGRIWVRGAATVRALLLERYGYFYAGAGTTADLLIGDGFESGMLHAFRARHIVDPSDAGADPSVELDTIQQAEWDYLHRYMVDEAFDDAERPLFLPQRLFELVTSGREFLRDPEHPFVDGTPVTAPDW